MAASEEHPVNIAARISIALLVGACALTLATTSFAAGRQRGPKHHPGRDAPHATPRPEAGKPEAGRPEHRPGEELTGRPGADRRRGCRRGVRPGPGVHCDYYYDDGDQAQETVEEPGRAAQPTTAPAAKIAPHAQSDGAVEAFSPRLGNDLKEELIAARKNWMATKSRLDDANAERARAEYQASRTGSAVDPAIIARQQQAREDAAAAQAAIAPLVEEGRKAGVAPEVLDLYERATRPE